MFVRDEAVVITDARFAQEDEGARLCDGFGEETYWEGYLQVFSTIYVIARSCTVERASGPAVQNPHVKFLLIPDFGKHRALRMAKVWNEMKQNAMLKKILSTRLVFFRLPSLTGLFLDFLFSPPWYAVEVVGDPETSLSGNSGSSWWVHRFVRPVLVHHMKKKVSHALGAAYVTRETLQKKYPTQSPIQSWYSNVILPKDSVRISPKQIDDTIHIAFVGSLVGYKGVDVLFQALKDVQGRWILHVFGKGSEERTLRDLAERWGLSHKIRWEGFLPRRDLLHRLQRCHLFVLPSRGGEGTPRALLEAMAVGLVPIASDVGGIGEILPSYWRVKAGDPIDLREKIHNAMKIIKDPQEYQKALDHISSIVDTFTLDKMLERRRSFYQKVQQRMIEIAKGNKRLP